MKFILKAMSCLSALILLCSCTMAKSNFYTPTVQSWRDANQQTLLARWGRPDKIIRSPNGTLFYLYQTENYRVNGNSHSPAVGVSFHQGGTPILTTAPNLNVNGGRGMSLLCTTLFEVNAQGVITNAYTQGNGCYASEKFAATMKNPMKQKP